MPSVPTSPLRRKQLPPYQRRGGDRHPGTRADRIPHRGRRPMANGWSRSIACSTRTSCVTRRAPD